MKKTITLTELVNYAAAACWQGYCQGSVAPKGDWDPTTEKWIKKQDAAETIIADFFFSGDREKALKYISENGEYIRGTYFIGDLDDLKKHPEDIEKMSRANREAIREARKCQD